MRFRNSSPSFIDTNDGFVETTVSNQCLFDIPDPAALKIRKLGRSFSDLFKQLAQSRFGPVEGCHFVNSQPAAAANVPNGDVLVALSGEWAIYNQEL